MWDGELTVVASALRRDVLLARRGPVVGPPVRTLAELTDDLLARVGRPPVAPAWAVHVALASVLARRGEAWTPAGLRTLGRAVLSAAPPSDWDLADWMDVRAAVMEVAGAVEAGVPWPVDGGLGGAARVALPRSPELEPLTAWFDRVDWVTLAPRPVQVARTTPADPLAEVAAMIARAHAALSSGTPPGEIALAFADIERHGPLARELLGRSALPWWDAAGPPLIGSPPARWVARVLGAVQTPTTEALRALLLEGWVRSEGVPSFALVHRLDALLPAARRAEGPWDGLGAVLARPAEAEPEGTLDRALCRLLEVLDALGRADLVGGLPGALEALGAWDALDAAGRSALRAVLARFAAAARLVPPTDAATALRRLQAALVDERLADAVRPDAVALVALEDVPSLAPLERVLVGGVDERAGRRPAVGRLLASAQWLGAARVEVSVAARDGDRVLRPPIGLEAWPEAAPVADGGWPGAQQRALGRGLREGRVDRALARSVVGRWGAGVLHGAQVEALRRRLTPGPHDGRVGARATETAAVQSVSRLERYARCPFTYWVRHRLRAWPRPRPRDRTSASERGRRIHRLLQEVGRFLTDGCGGEPPVVLAAADRAALAQSARAHARTRIEAALADERDPPVFARRARRRLARLLDCYIDAELAGTTRLAPARFELGFGIRADDVEQGSTDPVPLPGSRVALIGSIDRVDIARQGRLLYVSVDDYKTGAVPSISAVLGGVGFQLPLYLLILEPLLAEVKGDALVVPVAARYYQAADPLRFGRRGGIWDAETLERLGRKSRTDRGALTGDALDALLEHYRLLADEIVGRIAAGEHSTGLLDPRWMGCDGCACRSACRVDLARNAHRARAAEADPARAWLPRPLTTGGDA